MMAPLLLLMLLCVHTDRLDGPAVAVVKKKRDLEQEEEEEGRTGRGLKGQGVKVVLEVRRHDVGGGSRSLRRLKLR